MTQARITTAIDANGVATVTMNNPAKHNAFDDDIIGELTRAFEAVAANKNLRVMVLAATGKSFSAGADLGWMKRMAAYSYEENLRDARALAGMLKALNSLPIPTIARVQGGSFGGAVGLVACCDIAIATTRAKFCLSEVKIGLIPATISPYVIAAIGARASRRYFNTAEVFSAQTAANLGLVSEVVDEAELDKVVTAIIGSILGNSPAAIAASKQLIVDVAGKEITAQLIEHTSEGIARIRVSPEGQEGLAAFLEKRPAAYIPSNSYVSAPK